MKILLITCLAVLGTCNSFADNFQFTYREQKGEYKLVGLSYRVFDQRGKEILKGTTDGYGRAAISNIGHGKYTLELTMKSGVCKTQILVDGSRQIKQVVLSKELCR